MNEDLFINETRIDKKLDKILDKLSEHSAVLERHGVLHEKNAQELEKHIKRTDLLSDHMDAEHKDMKQNLDTALLPIKSFKFLAKLSAGILTLAALYTLIGKI
jgi:hypothetical protein